MTATLTLYDIESTLAALVEIDPEELTPELRAQYEIELLEALRLAPEKRDRVAMKLFDLGQRAQVKRAAALSFKQRAQELDASAANYERKVEQLKDYVLNVMREIPKPKRGPRILEGTSATFKAPAVADSVEIYDESLLPDEFRTAMVTMPLQLYRELAELCEDYSGYNVEPFTSLKVTWGRVEKSVIKKALESGEVPGARLITDKLRLVVE